MDYAMEYALMSDIYDEMTEANEGVLKAIGNGLKWLWERIVEIAGKISGIFKKRATNDPQTNNDKTQNQINNTPNSKSVKKSKPKPNANNSVKKVQKAVDAITQKTDTEVSTGAGRRFSPQIVKKVSDMVIGCINTDAVVITVSDSIGQQAYYQYMSKQGHIRNALNAINNLDVAVSSDEDAYDKLRNFIDKINSEGYDAHTSILDAAKLTNHDITRMTNACDKIQKLAEKIKTLPASGELDRDMKIVSDKILKAMNCVMTHVRFYHNTKIAA